MFGFGKRKRAVYEDHEAIADAVEAAICEWTDECGAKYEPNFERSMKEDYVDVRAVNMDNASVDKVLSVVAAVEAEYEQAGISPSACLLKKNLNFRVRKLSSRGKKLAPVAEEKILQLNGEGDIAVIKKRLESAKVDTRDVRRVAACVDFMRFIGAQEDILAEKSQMKYDVINTPERLVLTVKGLSEINENLIVAFAQLQEVRDVRVKLDFETSCIRCDVKKIALPVSK